MNIQFSPIPEGLQKKIIALATSSKEPRVAILLEDSDVFFLDTEKGEILLPRLKEEQDGGGQLDEKREGNVSEELQSETPVDGQGQKDSQGPSGEI